MLFCLFGVLILDTLQQLLAPPSSWPLAPQQATKELNDLPSITLKIRD